MEMDESYQLPPSWKAYKISLKHRNKQLSLKGLGQHLCIEVEIRLRDGKKDDDSLTSTMHMIEKGKTHKSE